MGIPELIDKATTEGREHSDAGVQGHDPVVVGSGARTNKEQNMKKGKGQAAHERSLS
ncbi:MAG TPA: hypothetical protein PLV87_04490 [Opitutaceae bacterium]|nr:hypothetical protein [Opitutaceae bacterium]